MHQLEADDVPEHLKEHVGRAYLLKHALLSGMTFIIKDAGRDPRFFENHLLSSVGQDLLQSIFSYTTLVRNGMPNVAKRELRFALETCIKLCYIQRDNYSSSRREKLDLFKAVLNSSKISCKNQIEFSMLDESIRADFQEELGRLYGESSRYVHLSAQQLSESISASEAGRISGQETADELADLNSFAERVFAAILVLMFHSVPEWVAGDFLVEQDGSTVSWHFTKSRFVSNVDQFFDYKHERQNSLQAIQKKRADEVSF